MAWHPGKELTPVGVPEYAAAEPLSSTGVPWKIGSEILKDYRIEGVLGEGGMGTVYLVARRGTDGARFAVKTLLNSALQDDESQRAFLRELRTWIDLPEHPHLTACRFFRTIGDRLAIFAEYVEGNALEHWIRERRLVRLEEILDVAIQVAWGLEAAHKQGVIHQDVKPANVLMSSDRIAKVSDFGLARARRASGADRTLPPGATSFLVSANGMTEAYCSPEQASWWKLTHHTDIWSYGLLVLEMFTGGVTWRHGTAAPHALESHLQEPPPAPFPAMPAGMAEVLLGCFRQEPNERWTSLGEVAARLQAVYREEMGRPYPRPRPEGKSRQVVTGVEHDRRIVATGTKWDNPVYWLKKALRVAGRDESEAQHLVADRTGSRQSQALADLEVYEEALRIYSSLAAQDRKQIEQDLAAMLINKAFVHGSVDDRPGAVAMYDQAIAIWERPVQVEGRGELANALAAAYMNKAVALSALGDKRAAIAMYDQAITIRERLVQVEGHGELRGDLAWLKALKASALLAAGDVPNARALARDAVRVLEAEIQRTGRSDLKNVLSWAKANLRSVLENPDTWHCVPSRWLASPMSVLVLSGGTIHD